MTTTIPNTSTSGTVGTPSPAAIATETLDGTGSVAATDAIQMVRLTPPERNALMALAALAGGINSSSQLRVLIDATNAGASLVVTLASLATLTNLVQIGGRDGTEVVPDISYTNWSNAVLPCIARA